VFGAIAEFEREIIRERTRAGLDAARSRGRKGGRPRSLSDKDLKQARALLTNPEITVEEVVGPSTLYRYLPAARQTAQDEA
jgi:DNA invertase Pin-like site-specific DNA recombinase